MKLWLALVLMFGGILAVAADTQDPEINKVFDRNKGGLFAEYSRARRDNPQLEGKIVFDFNIAKTGDVTACYVRFSNLGDPDLERRLCDRMSNMKFPPRQSAITATKTVDFFFAR